MGEVSCRATRLILDALDETQIPVEELVAGLPVPLSHLRDPGARVDWDVFTDLLARLDASWGDRLPLEEVGARILKVPSFDLLRRAGQLLMTPRQLYELANRFVAPVLFPNVVVTLEWRPAGRLLVTGDLLPGYRESVPFFRLCHGNVAVLPRLLDLPASRIEEQALTGRRGRLLLVPPPSHTLGARLARSARALGSLGQVLRGIEQHEGELARSLAALRDSRHEMQQLLERLPDGVMIHSGGVVRWANASLAETLGAARREDVLGREVLSFVSPEDRAAIVRALGHAAVNEVRDDRPEYRVLRADGTLRRVQAGTAQVIEYGGEPARMVVLRDVTEQHRLREQADISSRLASLGGLAAGVAHEINNPLAYTRLSLEIASHEATALGERCSPELGESLANAREGTERVLGIVRDLKMLSRIHDEPMEGIDLPALLESTLALAERTIAARAAVVRSYGPTPPARGTRGRLGQVFLNLLTNAADAIPEGAPSSHEIRVTTSTDGEGRAVVSIRDSGAGISQDIARRVFDPFFTTKPAGAGTGLGLAMCHRLVTEVGGTIDFESAPGATTFRVTLPAATLPAREPPARRAEEVGSARGRVLVVDDEPALLRSIQRSLADRHDVVTAGGAGEALSILGADAAFDVVLTDLMMGDKGGIELYEAARERHPALARRFLFMTGGAFTPRTKAFLAETSNVCLEKPFEKHELRAAIDLLVARARA